MKLTEGNTTFRKVLVCSDCGWFRKPYSSWNYEVCPKCGSSKLHRVVGTIHFVKKRGGWFSDVEILYTTFNPLKTKSE